MAGAICLAVTVRLMTIFRWLARRPRARLEPPCWRATSVKSMLARFAIAAVVLVAGAVAVVAQPAPKAYRIGKERTGISIARA